MKTLFLAFTGLICLASSSQAITIFSDTFNHGSGAGTHPLGTNIGPRQAGGTTTSSYSGSTTGGGNATLLNTSNLPGNPEVLLLRTFNTGGASQSAVDLDTNFASSLAGSKYTITLTNVNFQRSDPGIADVWFALSIGDSGGSITGPNNASADFALLLRPQDGGSNLWNDGASAAGFAMPGSGAGFGAGTSFGTVVMTIDETGGIGSATGQVEVMAPGGTYTSPVVNFDFGNTTNRFLELRGHQGPAGPDGQLMDLRFDSLAIDVIVPIPEPSTAVLGALGALMLFRRKR